MVWSVCETIDATIHIEMMSSKPPKTLSEEARKVARDNEVQSVPDADVAAGHEPISVAGFLPFPALPGVVIDSEMVRALMDEEGI